VAITIRVVFADGTKRSISDHDTLEEAVLEALELADTHGADPGDSAGRPKRIEVWTDGKVALSLAVLRGGLIPKASR
jgi:hypothetical protein